MLLGFQSNGADRWRGGEQNGSAALPPSLLPSFPPSRIPLFPRFGIDRNTFMRSSGPSESPVLLTALGLCPALLNKKLARSSADDILGFRVERVPPNTEMASIRFIVLISKSRLPQSVPLRLSPGPSLPRRAVRVSERERDGTGASSSRYDELSGQI